MRDTKPIETAGRSWTAVITPHKPVFHIPAAEIWSYRDLVVQMVRRDLITQHKQTVLGPLWFFIQPLLSSVVYTVIFGRIANIPTDTIPPFLFYLSGVTIWSYFASVLARTSSTFTSNGPIFSKIYFPRLTVPIAQALVCLVLFLVQLLIFAGFYLFYLFKGAPIEASYRIVIVPALIVQSGLLGFGVGCLISALTVRFRDLQLAIGPGIQLWMYASCIFYPRSIVPESYQWLMSINPMVPVIEAFRFAVMGRGEVEISQWLISVALTIVIFVVGIIAFGRAEKTSVDTI